MTMEEMVNGSNNKTTDRKFMIDCINRWGGKATTKWSTPKLISAYTKLAAIEAEREWKKAEEKKIENIESEIIEKKVIIDKSYKIEKDRLRSNLSKMNTTDLESARVFELRYQRNKRKQRRQKFALP